MVNINNNIKNSEKKRTFFVLADAIAVAIILIIIELYEIIINKYMNDFIFSLLILTLIYLSFLLYGTVVSYLIFKGKITINNHSTTYKIFTYHPKLNKKYTIIIIFILFILMTFYLFSHY